VGITLVSSGSRASAKVAINDNAIPKRDSLARIAEYMGRKPCIGVSQGIMLDLRGGGVDAVGCYMGKILRISNSFSGRRPEETVDILSAPVT